MLAMWPTMQSANLLEPSLSHAHLVPSPSPPFVLQFHTYFMLATLPSNRSSLSHFLSVLLSKQYINIDRTWMIELRYL